MSQSLPARGRIMLVVALVTGIGMLAWLVFNPSDALTSTAIANSRRWMWAHGVPRSLASSEALNFVFNVAMFLPLVAAGALLWPRPSVAGWTLLALVLAVAIETTQLLFLPERGWSWWDIAGDVVGGLAGATIARLVRR